MAGEIGSALRSLSTEFTLPSSVPRVVSLVTPPVINMTAGHATLKHDHPCPLRARFHTPDYPRARKLLHPRKLFHPLPEVADDCLVVEPSRLAVAAEGD